MFEVLGKINSGNCTGVKQKSFDAFFGCCKSTVSMHPGREKQRGATRREIQKLAFLNNQSLGKTSKSDEFERIVSSGF